MSVRKRLQQNQQVVETDTKTSNFSDEVEVKQHEIQTYEDVKIPDKYFMGSNLKSILPDDYRTKRKDIKHDKYVRYWECEINNILDVYDKDADKYHIQLVKSIMQIVEDYVIFDTKTGKMKKAIVKNICLKFFDENEKLLDAIIEDQLHNIVHSTLFRRLMARLQVAFFSKL